MIEARQLKGIIVPLVTPLNRKEQIDEEGMVRLIEYVISGGVHGVFVMGTSGEFARLSDDQWKQATALAIEAVDGRVPVFAGISAPGTKLALQKAGWATELGADVLVATPPYYFPVSQQEIEFFYSSLTRVVDTPLMLYDIPSTTHAHIEMETAIKLSRIEGIVGIKDSSGDWMQMKALLKHFEAREDFKVFVGEEAIMKDALLTGAHGGVPASGNLLPRHFSRLYEAANKGNAREAEAIHVEFRSLDAWLKSQSDAPTSWLSAKKAALEVMGICSGRMSAPQQSLNPEAHQRMRAELKKRGLLPPGQR